MKKINILFAVAILSLSTSCKKETTSDSEINSQAPEVTLTDDVNEKVDEGKPLSQDKVKANVKTTVMTFDKVEHDFGVIKQGSKVDYSFKFTNTGENDLIITDAKGSCGCTVPDYPKEAVKPGESGKIKVSFDSNKKSGKQTKTVSIFANTANGSEKLTIKSNIIVE